MEKLKVMAGNWDQVRLIVSCSTSAALASAAIFFNLSSRCFRNFKKIRAFNVASASRERILLQNQVAAEKTLSTSVEVGLIVNDTPSTAKLAMISGSWILGLKKSSILGTFACDGDGPSASFESSVELEAVVDPPVVFKTIPCVLRCTTRPVVDLPQHEMSFEHLLQRAE